MSNDIDVRHNWGGIRYLVGAAGVREAFSAGNQYSVGSCAAPVSTVENGWEGVYFQTDVSFVGVTDDVWFRVYDQPCDWGFTRSSEPLYEILLESTPIGVRLQAFIITDPPPWFCVEFASTGSTDLHEVRAVCRMWRHRHT